MSYKRDVKITCPTYASTSTQSKQTQHLVDNSKSNPKVQTKLKTAFVKFCALLSRALLLPIANSQKWVRE